ncbi:MAG: orotate phosphoribosyltransferase [Alphaproteobacteria bacterium]|nr:orotate phosphoribosyltransferase [Alphaproteobacteria bacterium]
MKKINSIAAQLISINAVKLQPNNPFTWASGWKSPIYCDNRKALSHVGTRDDIVSTLVDLARSFEPEAIVGVATGADSWGALVADWAGPDNTGLPFAYVRSKAKDHGLGNQIEGDLPEGCKVVVVEDLISTGGSSLKAVQALRDAGFEVLGMVAISSYQFPIAEQAFADAGVTLKTATNYTEIVEAGFAAGQISDTAIELLAQWRLSPDTWGK